MSKWLLSRPNSENLKTKNFGVGDQWDKNDHYFRTYMRQETLIDQYELLYACAL